jgi:TrmH family RNA methyltransferase
MRRIASRHNPIVSRYRLAARGDADGVILLDGVHLVSEAIAAGARVREAAVAAASADDAEVRGIADRLSRAGVDVVSATAPVMAALSGVRSSSAVVALVERPTCEEGDVFGGRALVNGAPLVIVLVDLQDPGNVGAIIRVAEAGGATGVIVTGASADPFGWKALRGSMGSALRLPIIVRKGPVPLEELRRRQCRIVAATPRDGRSVFDVDFSGPTAVLIGGEGPGLAAAVVAAADECVSIPMAAPVESLNAAATAAVVVYEAQRQRR